MSWPVSCVKQAEPLANHTSFRIGGPAEWYAEPSSIDELLLLLRGANRLGIPVSVIGGGTNLLVSDRGVRGLVIRLGRSFRVVDVVSPDEAPEALVRCSAGVMTQHLVWLAGQLGWGGLEPMAGLPGQIGGAVMMNAQNIGQFVESVTLATHTGEIKQITRDQLNFSYRFSAIEPGIVLEALLRFPKMATAGDGIRQALSYRNTTQDLNFPSAGCAFKNPPGNSAGRMLDQAGLKGQRIGDAQISTRHANFIVNLGYATCDDVLALMEHAQRQVCRVFGVHLEPEVRMLGDGLAP